LNYEDFNLTIPDIENTNNQLKGFWIKAETNPRAVMLLIHGVGGCKEHFLGLAKLFAERGIESILYDGRAHGESGGQYCTYGYYEKEDVSKAVDAIQAKYPDIPIGIWGNSLGGAIAFQAMEQEKRIQFGVIESTFTDLRQIVYDYKKRYMLGLGIRWVANYALDRAGEIARFDPDAVKPIESVQHIEQAIFLAHGDVDKRITPEYGEALYQNLKSTDKEFFLVKGAGHHELLDTDNEELEERILAFIERQLVMVE